MTPAKRGFDVVVSAIALVASAPIIALAGFGVWLQDRGPIFFRQERVGRGGARFILFKIRSMTLGADSGGSLVTAAGDRRITRVGRLLRRTKLDELPQFWNVLRGDMSLVGPRPEVARYVDMYSADQRSVLELTPGVTDPATVAFSNEEALLATAEDPEAFYVKTVMPRKIEMNLRYSATATVWTDVSVLLATAGAICRARRQTGTGGRYLEGT